MDYDLKITGGTVIDGTGAARYRSDVAVRGGRIAAVGMALGSAGQTINAEGCVVAPGFIQTDMTHALTDEQRQAMVQKIALRRPGTPKDVAGAGSVKSSAGT